MGHIKTSASLTSLLFFFSLASPAHALDWSNTSIGYRYGSQFAEPKNSQPIKKNIVNFSHADGYAYGSQFLNADFLVSNQQDPANTHSNAGAQEVYLLYRHTLDLGKVQAIDYQWGPIRSIGLTAGFDLNKKNDVGYNSKKRMLVAGPTLMLNVPGFLNVSLLSLWESNAPYNSRTHVKLARYAYDTHPMLNVVWGIPIADCPLSFEGYANFIAPKGKNEFGADTVAETNIDMQILYDISGLIEAKAKTLRVGAEYQYWRNKFGNNADGIAGPGAFAKTPMLRVEYRF